MKYQDPEGILNNVRGYEAGMQIMFSKIEIPVVRGVEIGLGWGLSARSFLRAFPDAILASYDVNTELEAVKRLRYEFPARHAFADRNVFQKTPVVTYQWLYIDGGHEYEDVKHDIEVFEPMLEVGGVIAFDDYGGHNPQQRYNYPGVTRAVNEFFDLEQKRFKNFTAVHMSETGPLCAVKVAA